MRFVSLAALCLALLPAQEKPKPGFDKVALEAYVRHLLAVIPEVQVKIEDPKPSQVSNLEQVDVHFIYGERTQDETFYVSKDGHKIIRGYIYDLSQNPFKEDLDKLKTSLSPSFGAAGAPVVLVVFSDFECPNCKEEAKTLRQNLSAAFPKDVRVYFKDFPLEQIHPWAKPAAIAGQCVFRENPAAFWQFHDWIYEHQSEITPDNLKTKVLEFAQTAKDLDGMQLGRCMDSKATEADVNASIAQGKALKIDATPTMFVNGRRLIGNYPWQNLQQIISGELNYQKSAQNAGEKCCELKIPNPLNK
ncbi:MAG TPA: thioredoxin domain-containing protein [Bryobacteraceae bacterium]|jgi:protein-disulfide isomerase|nr:thioredoxin domain-containing protein [Bryobacteraceae bacterium]